MELIQIVDNNRTDKNTNHSYLDLYQNLLCSKKDSARNVLEIGIFNGGSIKLWYDYFQNATIYALDIMEDIFIYHELKGKDRIKLYPSTNAYDEDFFKTNLLDTNNKFDVMLDDGPHTLESMKTFIRLYSQLMTDDGILIVEDIQSIDWIPALINEVPEHLKQYINVYDLRHKKGRYDDIVLTIDKSNTPEVLSSVRSSVSIGIENKQALSSYRLGDLIYGNLTYNEATTLINEHPNTIGRDYIYTPKPKYIGCIDTVKNIVLSYIEKHSHLFPDDITESTVIHLRLGDVIAGNEWHEKRKRPLTVEHLRSILPADGKKVYVIGNCHFGKVLSQKTSTNYEECLNASNEYLQSVLNEFNATHFDGGHADIDLCFAVKAKYFIQGKGFYSKLIVDVRKEFNLDSIETPTINAP